MSAYCRASDAPRQLKLVVNIDSVIERHDYPELSVHFHLTLDEPGFEEPKILIPVEKETF